MDYNNNYIIDLRYAKSASDIIFEFSSMLDNELVKNKKIFLKLGDVELNPTQLQSIKSLINSINSILTVVETKNVQTQQSALSMGLIVENPEAVDITSQSETVLTPSEAEVKSEETKEEELSEESNSGEILVSNESSLLGIDTFLESSKEDTSSQNQKISEELDIIFDEEKKLEELLEHKQDSESSEVTVKADSEYTQQDYEIDNLPTMYIKQTLRSGQAINFEGNIVIIGDAHCGSEINATGDITVWGILSGIAHAGASGNEKARIRALKMNALQLRIADWYSRRPDDTRVTSQERTSTFEPEEARVVDGVVSLFKIYEKI